ncbi:hypothetical protein OJAV_G00202300 [Oryzias javanicus]|uniref:AIG1-type G domain-containing protein n=1 Tax=Oryzias javanicus TaxID=123683 RepID=A0A3S2NRT6_ORYJA|nr:hypothetical protein OJAV_G00202300 [Oryzias javanicus]
MEEEQLEVSMSCRADVKDGVAPRPQKLRLVLLGDRWLDKSVAGNSILRRHVFDLSRDVKMCLKGQSVLEDGRKVVVVSTPERWVHYSIRDPGLLQVNMNTCMAMCPPGPHAFLVVVPVSSLRGREWTVEGPLALLGDTVWRSTLVVFVRRGKLRGSSVESFISKHDFLKALVEKCGNRYQLLDASRSKGCKAQVDELLGKIDAMVEMQKKAGGAGYVAKEEEVSTETEEKKNDVEERASSRRNRAQRRRRTLRSLLESRSSSPAQLQVLLVGAKHAGKTSSANTLLGGAVFPQAGDRPAQVVDSPGWHGRYCSGDTPQALQQQITHSASVCDPHAVLLVLRCDETFTETDRRTAEEHMGRLGFGVWSRTVVLFTRGDGLGGATIEEHIGRWRSLERLVERCGNRYHVFDNTNRAGSFQVRELYEKIEETLVENDASLLLETLENLLQQKQQNSKKALRKMKKVKMEKKKELKEKEEQIEKLQKMIEAEQIRLKRSSADGDIIRSLRERRTLADQHEDEGGVAPTCEKNHEEPVNVWEQVRRRRSQRTQTTLSFNHRTAEDLRRRSTFLTASVQPHRGGVSDGSPAGAEQEVGGATEEKTDAASSWPTAGAAALGAAVGTLVPFLRLPAGIGVRSAVFPAAGAALGSMLIQRGRLGRKELGRKELGRKELGRKELGRKELGEDAQETAEG